MAWTDNVPLAADQVASDLTAMNANFTYLHTLMENHYKTLSDSATTISKSSTYFVDSTETDQGVAGSGRSVKDLVDAIGATKRAKLIFTHHAADGNETSYYFKTSEDILRNIEVYVDPGARIVTYYSVRNATYQWSNHAASIYYLELAGGGSPGISEVTNLYENGTELTEVADIAAMTSAGTWCWSSNTVYVWLTDSADPDAKATNYVLAGVKVRIENVGKVPMVQWMESYGQVEFAYGSILGVFSEWFGAVGDNSTDCSTAVSNAIRCAIRNKVDLIVPYTGLYSIQSKVSFTETSALEFTRFGIVGPHDGGKFAVMSTESSGSLRGGFKKDMTGDNMFEFIGYSNATKMRAPRIHGVMFVGDNSTDEDYSLLYVENCSAMHVNHNVFTQYVGNGAKLVNMGDAEVIGNMFTYLGSAANTRFALEITTDSSATGSTASNQNRILSNHFENFRYGAFKYSGYDTTVTAIKLRFMLNKVHGNTGTGPGILLQNTDTYGLISCNDFVNLPLNAIELANAKYISINDNYVGATGFKLKLTSGSIASFDQNRTNGYKSFTVTDINRNAQATVTFDADHDFVAGEIGTYVHLDTLTGDWSTMNVNYTGIVQLVAIPSTSSIQIDLDTSGVSSAYSSNSGKIYCRYVYISDDGTTASTLYMGDNYIFGAASEANYHIPPGWYGDSGYEDFHNLIYRMRNASSVLHGGKVDIFGAYASTDEVINVNIMGEQYNRIIIRPDGIRTGTGSAATAPRVMTDGRFRCPSLTAEPSSPTNGDIVYADGTSWNPGSGAGFYGREGGAWVKL